MLRRIAAVCGFGTLLFVFQGPVAYAQPDPPPEKPCPVDFVTPRRSAARGMYIEVDYGFDENCRPVLIAVRTAPLPVPEDEQQPVSTDTDQDTSEGRLAGRPAPLAALAAATTNVCHTETWETDFAYIRTTQVQNDTSYTWNGSAITSWGVTATKKLYFTWWYVSSGPSASFTLFPSTGPITNITGKAKASFYCNGGPFCANGPMYAITMNAYTYVNKSGGCSSNGTYSGTVIPGGHVLFRNWKN